jgi:SAM-dependent methyltransferase
MNPIISSSPAGTTPPVANTDDAVARRYAAAAERREAALCCPVTYDSALLEKIPQEIIDKDYGCGDPTAYVRAGDTVLDLGSGGGKLCYIAAQMVGAGGRVIGVDCNQTMLELSRKYLLEMADRFGYANVDFRFGRIQDLALDLDEFYEQHAHLEADGPQRSIEILNLMRSLRSERPMIASDSVDCLISNCVLNLVNAEDRQQLFREIYRVLKKGGRVAISDIVCDEDVPAEMRNNGHLWSGCISGAWREDRFLEEFVEAGFHGVTIDQYQHQPWQVIDGIEFRSVTIMAYKGKEGACRERNQAVIYKGPFETVKDDDGHIYQRGQRVAVCDKTFQLLMSEPYVGMFVPVEPIDEIPLAEATEFDCRRSKLRSPHETKGLEYHETRVSEGACDASGGCC